MTQTIKGVPIFVGSGGGGTPGSPALSIQGASADGTAFVGIPGTVFDAASGVTEIASTAGLLLQDNSAAGNTGFIENGNTPLVFESIGSGGIISDSSGADIGGGGTGVNAVRSANGIEITDSSVVGIAMSSDGPFTFDLKPVLTSLVGTTSTIGGSALTLGQQATGNVVITGATAAIAAGGVIQATPVTANDPGNGFIWTANLTSTLDTIVVKVVCLVAGTPVSTTYQVKVF